MAKEAKQKAREQKFINGFWMTLTIVIAICTIIVSFSTIGDMLRTRSHRKNIERKISSLERKIEADSIFIENISTSPEFMEEYARETYHMQRKGETVYIME